MSDRMCLYVSVYVCICLCMSVYVCVCLGFPSLMSVLGREYVTMCQRTHTDKQIYTQTHTRARAHPVRHKCYLVGASRGRYDFYDFHVFGNSRWCRICVKLEKLGDGLVRRCVVLNGADVWLCSCRGSSLCLSRYTQESGCVGYLYDVIKERVCTMTSFCDDHISPGDGHCACSPSSLSLENSALSQ